MQSFILDFRKSPTFMRKWNKEFDVEALAANCYYVVLVDDSCNDNIRDCLNEDGQVRYTEEHLLIASCSLKYEIGANEDEYVVLDGDVEIDFPYTDLNETVHTDFNMKGVFITTDSGYVMGASINTYSLKISNKFILENGLKLWTIVEGNINGE